MEWVVFLNMLTQEGDSTFEVGRVCGGWVKRGEGAFVSNILCIIVDSTLELGGFSEGWLERGKGRLSQIFCA